MVGLGLVARAGGHVDPDFLAALHKVADGVIGRVSRLTEAALEICLRRGGDCITLCDLSLATEQWAMPQGFVKANPFRGIA